MKDLPERIAGLSAKKREIFLRMLADEGIVPPDDLLAPSDESIKTGVAPSEATRTRARVGQMSDLTPLQSAQPEAKIASLDSPVDVPLSYAQQRLWFMDQLMPGNAFYNKNIAVRLSTAIDADILELSLNDVVARQASLRASFREVNEKPVQSIAARLKLQLERVDLCSLAPAARDKQAQRLALEATTTPFDLSNGPLVRVSLLRLREHDYLFLLTMHHIVCDGWSLNVLFRELTAIYAARLSGQSADLPELTVQYADFAVWQRDRLRGALLDKLLAYWTGQLQGLPVMQLPVDRPRPAMQSFQGGVRYASFDSELTDRLRQLGRKEGATLFMTLLSAFDVLLGYYCGQEDIVVGTYAANRDRPELEPLVGFFVNALVLRTSLAGNPSFRELLHRVRDVALAAYAHQELPFEKLVEELQPERDLGRNPLFQVVFQLETLPTGGATSTSGTSNVWSTASGTAAFDLAFNLADGPQGLTLKLEYSSDLFDDDTARRLEQHYHRILEQFSRNPECRLSEIAWLDAADIRREQTRFAAGGPPALASAAHELFEMQARRVSDSTAVSDAHEALTYRELDRRANRLARVLARSGICPGDLVGICLDRSADMLATLLAIWKCGAAYVPLDPAFPTARIEHMVDDANLKRIVTTSVLAPQLSTVRATPLVLDALADADTDIPGEHTLQAIDANALAYVLYTSGSTGKPKGVAVHHGAVVNLLASMLQSPGLTPGDTLVAVTTLSFDISVLELLLPLAAGAKLVIADRDTTCDPERLAQLLDDANATVMQGTPATWQMLIDNGWDGRPDLKALCGGEALRRDLADELLALTGSVWNLYGPTETTIWCSVVQVDKRAGPVPIGGPILHTQLYLLDSYGRLAPPGVAGELCIAGYGVARGYLNRPALTAERFVPNPFCAGDDPPNRMYRSGDLMRYRADGNLDFLGRLDSQVKLRGFRLELEEIETALASHSGVRQAAVRVYEDSTGNKHLAAYIVPESHAAPAPAELMRSLQRVLPDYMVPGSYETLDELPLTQNRKIDRNALPLPQGDAARVGTEYVAPRTPVEQDLVAIWKKVLGVERVGIDDDFFALGGHSLLATQVVSRTRRTLDIEVTLRQVFETPTVRGLAEIFSRHDPSAAGRQPAIIKPVARDGRRLPVD